MILTSGKANQVPQKKIAGLESVNPQDPLNKLLPNQVPSTLYLPH